MSFSRTAPGMLVGEALDGAMRSVGLRVGTASPTGEPADLELTLVSAAAAALPEDYRLLGVLAAWLEVHHPYVNVPRLKRFLRSDTRPIARAWWASIAKWLGRHDPRWRTLQKLYRGLHWTSAIRRLHGCNWSAWAQTHVSSARHCAFTRNCCARVPRTRTTPSNSPGGIPFTSSVCS